MARSPVVHTPRADPPRPKRAGLQLTRLMWVMAFLSAAQAGAGPARVRAGDQATATQQPPQQEQPPPTIRVGTEIVRVDVTVLDRRGRPVTDLTMEDFV